MPMKNYKQNSLWLFFMLIVLSNVSAQHTIPVSGGNAAGINGSASYTVGQLINSSENNGNASVSHGIQVAFEVIATGTDVATSSTPDIEAYPNPTISGITIRQHNQKSLHYSLFDITGKLIDTREITTDETLVKMETLAGGTYILKVNDPKSEIKSFKIIKH